MSRFESRPTRDFLAAVAALCKLDWEGKTRAFAEASAPDLEKQATEECGKRITKGKSWRRLKGEIARDDDCLPGDDHVELRLGGTGAYTSHPYQLDLEELRQIVAVCDANELNVQIDARSWHFPGRTIRVSYTAQSR